MEFDTDATVDEKELDALGIKKKDDIDLATDPIDAVDVDTPIDPLLEEEKEKDSEEENIFGVEKDTVEYMFGPDGIAEF